MTEVAPVSVTAAAVSTINATAAALGYDWAGSPAAIAVIAAVAAVPWVVWQKARRR